MRRAASASFALASFASAVMACQLLVDTGNLSGNESSDSGSPGSVGSEGGIVDGGAVDSGGGDSGDVDAKPPTLATPVFDQGSSWPVFTSAKSTSPTTPVVTTSAACTDLVVLANSGISAGSTATATISSSTGMTFTEVIKDAGNNADTIYIWRATNSCASRSGTVTVTWSLSGGSIFWSNVAVFGFTHSNGIGVVANAHNPGNTSINTISISPRASGSWIVASLSGNNSNNADTVGTAGNYVQQWSGEGAIQSYGASQAPAAATAGVPVTFSLTSADSIWASAAAEVLSL